jgi:hypothetical protein
MDDAALDAWIGAETEALGIEVKPAWREAVRMHMRISLGHAKTVLDADPGDHVDQAPVFRA